jgi:hypothetical protein
MATSFTPLQPMLGIAHGDLSLMCGFSAMETHFMELPTNSFFPDIASRCSLELGSACCNRGQTILMRFSTLRSRSVSLCGLPLRDWAVVAPRRNHYTITALRVDRSSSSRAEIWHIDFLERWRSLTVPRCHVESYWALQYCPIYGDYMAVCSISYTCQPRLWLE